MAGQTTSAQGCADASRLLRRWSQGDRDALASLMPLVYGELQRLARVFLRTERTGHTLETSALIHEAFLRLIGQDRVQCRHRRQFFAIAATTMRRILVEHARRRSALKNGGNLRRVRIDLSTLAGVALDPDLLALDDALDVLAKVAPQQARLVELRYFGGLDASEIANVLHLSVPTVTRRWRAARAWLYRFIADERTADRRPARAGGQR